MRRENRIICIEEAGCQEREALVAHVDEIERITEILGDEPLPEIIEFNDDSIVLRGMETNRYIVIEGVDGLKLMHELPEHSEIRLEELRKYRLEE